MSDNNREYVVQFKMCNQIGPDEFDTFHPTMKVTPQTTVAEIDEFYRRYNRWEHAKLSMSIIELETIPAGERREQ